MIHYAAAETNLAPPPVALDPAEHRRLMREVMDVRRFNGGDRRNPQYFSGLLVNRDSGAEHPSLVFLNGLGEGAKSLETRYRAYQLGARFPGQPVLCLDLPAHGQSSISTPAQRKEIYEHGNMYNIARAMAQAICFALPNEQVAFAGYSLGAFMMAPVMIKASDFCIRPVAAIGQEVVGLERRTRAGVLAGHYVVETVRQRRYGGQKYAALRREYDAFVQAAKAAQYDPAQHNPWRVFRDDPRLVRAMILRGPLATDQSFQNLRILLRTYQQMPLTLLTAGQSADVRWPRIAHRAQEFCAEYAGRVQWHVWPQDTHGLGLAPNQPRLAEFIRGVLHPNIG